MVIGRDLLGIPLNLHQASPIPCTNQLDCLPTGSQGIRD